MHLLAATGHLLISPTNAHPCEGHRMRTRGDRTAAKRYAGHGSADNFYHVGELPFLCDECGFDRDHIRRLPVILGHDHALLREHWTILLQRDELLPFDEWTRDRWRLLNVLQYFIERKQFQTSGRLLKPRVGNLYKVGFINTRSCHHHSSVIL